MKKIFKWFEKEVDRFTRLITASACYSIFLGLFFVIINELLTEGSKKAIFLAPLLMLMSTIFLLFWLALLIKELNQLKEGKSVYLIFFVITLSFFVLLISAVVQYINLFI